MNIFVLDIDPKIAATFHCDKHVVKMIVESTQMLTNAYYSTVLATSQITELFKTFPRTDESGNPLPYKKTHYNHPCSIWARTSLDNFNWLLEMSNELCVEYTKRYNKHHKCQEYLNWISQNLPNIQSIGLTKFATAMPVDFITDDPISSYKIYYRSKKSYMKLNYKLGNIPEFLKD